MKNTDAGPQWITDLRSRITALEGETAALRTENAALRARMPEATGEATRKIVHDLCNILQVIMNKAENVLDDASVPNEMCEQWQTIFDAAVRGAKLARQLSHSGKRTGAAGTAAAPAKSPAAGRRSERSPSTSITRGHVLVAEDQTAVRTLVQTMLENANYRVSVVANGADAVAATAETEFDLVLMDMQMPIMDGSSAAVKIRQLAGPRSRVPVIGISGAELSYAAESSSFDDCITKPFTFAALLEKVDTWITRKGGPDEAKAAAPGEAEGPSLVELDGLMGRAWVERGLSDLMDRLDELFAAHETASDRNKDRLAGRAHALVSLAGLLGFTELSRRCSSLEKAAVSECDVLSALAEVGAAALPARAKAAEVLSGRSSRDQGPSVL
jgi:CheY-like chemotaxis protein/HPt (histidine-containing phosphotransfer) domain-containing protein